MVRYSILRNSVIQFVILSGLTIFAMTTIYAQSGGTTGQSPPGQKGAASGQESSLPRNDDTPTGQDMPNHSGSPSVSLPSDQEASLGEDPPPPEPRSLFHKIIKIFFGRNSLPGPNRDVDTNISAGGAGGG